jgi:hypothetical protein
MTTPFAALLQAIARNSDSEIDVERVKAGSTAEAELWIR